MLGIGCNFQLNSYEILMDIFFAEIPATETVKENLFF